MIRINLLAVRVSKKKQAGRQQLLLGVAVILLAFAGNFLWSSARAGALQDRQDKIARTRAEIAQLEKIIGEVNDIKQQQQAVKDKLAVLDKLKAGRTGPVKMLDELATLMPKRVWLTKVDEKGGAIVFAGAGVSIDDVSAFMSALKHSPQFSSVELKKTTAKTSGKYKTAEFVVEAKVNPNPNSGAVAAAAR
jgi:type IV pilus assembly protein PilN